MLRCTILPQHRCDVRCQCFTGQEDKAISQKKKIFACFGVVLLVVMTWATLKIHSANSAYNRFVDRAVFENGVQINLVGTSNFSRNDNSDVIDVGLNPAATSESKALVRAVYSFLGGLSGRSVRVTEEAHDLLLLDRYVYVASPVGQQQNAGDVFVRELHGSAERFFPNARAGEFWSYLHSALPSFNGTPFFFNSEFVEIDFNTMIRDKSAHKPANTKIEKTVVYVNASKPIDQSGPENQAFSNYIALQEIFQEYNIAPDVKDPEFKLKTILHDHDEALGNLMGTPRRDELKKNAAIGLCLFDVMLTKQLRQSGGNNPTPAGLATFVSQQVSAYYYRWTASGDLFDDRCW